MESVSNTVTTSLTTRTERSTRVIVGENETAAILDVKTDTIRKPENNPASGTVAHPLQAFQEPDVSSHTHLFRTRVPDNNLPDDVTAGSSKWMASSVQQQPLAKKRIFKIIVIGDSNVGKTCLTYRFCAGKFPEKTEATIGVDFREKTLDISGETVKLQIWDTAGQERFRKSMVQHYYRNVHAVVFVYDITKSSSFENLPNWIDECDANNLGKDVPRILVGNKCDERRRATVNVNVAQRFADSYQMPLFETSAKDNSEADHIESIFLTIAHKLKNSKPMMPAARSQSSVAQQTINLAQKNDVRRNNSQEDVALCYC